MGQWPSSNMASTDSHALIAFLPSLSQKKAEDPKTMRGRKNIQTNKLEGIKSPKATNTKGKRASKGERGKKKNQTHE